MTKLFFWRRWRVVPAEEWGKAQNQIATMKVALDSWQRLHADEYNGRKRDREEAAALLEQKLSSTAAELDELRQMKKHKDYLYARELEQVTAFFNFRKNLPVQGELKHDLLTALSVVHENTPWWKALRAFLEAEAVRARDDAADPNATGGLVDIRRGRLGYILDLIDTLDKLWVEARRPK